MNPTFLRHRLLLRMLRRRERAIACACLLAASLLAGGCATDRVSASAVTFATGASALHAQSDDAFNDVITLTRTSALEYVVARRQINEDDLTATPSPAAVDAWNKVLEALEQYGHSLAALAANGAANSTDSAIGDLAQQLNATSRSLKTTAGIGSGWQAPAGPVAALASIAHAISDAIAQKEALTLAARTNPSIQVLVRALAEAIGDSHQVGLRRTVRENWDQQLGTLALAFHDEPADDKRRALGSKYIDLLAKRDAADSALGNLRSSCLALGDAHAALAAGDSDGLKGAVAFVSDEAAHDRELAAQLRTKLAP